MLTIKMLMFLALEIVVLVLVGSLLLLGIWQLIREKVNRAH